MPPPTPPIPLLIASLGNPGPQYAHTLHSAGHIVLRSLATHLQHPPFTPTTRLFAHGLLSSSPTSPYTLWQSPTYMNTSGPAVAQTFRAWLALSPSHAAAGKLVIVHDEMEEPLGRLRVRGSGASARGHKGVRSCVEALGAVGSGRWVRVGVGVGRCEGRGSEEVSAFLLGEMGGRERRVLGGRGEGLVGVLGGIAWGVEGGGGGGG